MRTRELLKKFERHAFIVRARIWTPKRGTIDVEGGFPDHIGKLMVMLVSRQSYSPSEKQKIRELVDLLWPKDD